MLSSSSIASWSNSTRTVTISAHARRVSRTEKDSELGVGHEPHAGYKIKPYLIAQTLTQIVEEYGRTNPSRQLLYQGAFQTDNLQTCKNLSELSGNMTVEKETVNYSGNGPTSTQAHLRSVEQFNVR